MIESGASQGSSYKERISGATSIRAYVSNLISQVPQDQEFDANKILEENPEVRNHRSLVLDLAYEEYCRRVENGDRVPLGSFAKQFPQYEESLLRVLQVHQYLEKPSGDSEKNLPSWPQPGDVFGEYELQELIGRGSFAYVFIARQLNVADRRVVLKISRNAFDEIETLGRLDHPNIVQIFTVESNVDGFTAICMPLISRITLFDLLGEIHSEDQRSLNSRSYTQALFKCHTEFSDDDRDKTASELAGPEDVGDAVLRIGIDIADALEYSHSRGILHCDIKPTNILISADGKAMLFDFNLSTSSDAKSGRVGGTLPYMPPEQLQALLENDEAFNATPRVDIYSLGVTLYQVLTGRLPYGDLPETGTQQEAARILLDRQIEKRSGFEKIRGISPSLQATIFRCLATRIEDRPESAKQLGMELRKELNLFRRSRRWFIKHPVKLTVAATCGVTFLPALLMTHRYIRDIPRNKVLDLLRQGRLAEKQRQLSCAISLYVKAVELSKFDQQLEFQSRAFLAIAYVRKTAQQRLVSQLKFLHELSHVNQQIAWSVELACLAGYRQIAPEELSRGNLVFNHLREFFGTPSLDNENNHHVLNLMWEKNNNRTDISPRLKAFQSILDRDPRHPEAAYNLFMLQRTRSIRDNTEDQIDPEILQICLQENGELPSYLTHFVSQSALQIQPDSPASIDKFVYWVRKFIMSGAKKSVVEGRIKRFEPELQEIIFSRIADLQYNSKPVDRLIFRGIANPLDSAYQNI